MRATVSDFLVKLVALDAASIFACTNFRNSFSVPSGAFQVARIEQSLGEMISAGFVSMHVHIGAFSRTLTE
jgi:hypothetical protein